MRDHGEGRASAEVGIDDVVNGGRPVSLAKVEFKRASSVPCIMGERSGTLDVMPTAAAAAASAAAEGPAAAIAFLEAAVETGVTPTICNC